MSEVGHGFLRGARVHHLAPHQEQQVVQQAVDGTARLVDAANDGVSILCQLAQRLHHFLSLEGVQSRGGFVREEDGWGGHKLGGNGEALLLPSAQAALFGIPHPALRTEGLARGASGRAAGEWEAGDRGTYQSQPLDESVHVAVGFLRCHGSGEAQACCHLERLTNGKLREEDVFLANICLPASQQRAVAMFICPLVSAVAR